jgi:uncharacterized protein (TIGR00369 family)
MDRFEAQHLLYAERVRESFSRQRVMDLIGATLGDVEPGRVTIALAHRADLVQQHGYVHAGIVGTIADSAGGYAAYTLMPEGSSVLSVEYKLNLLAPADGERLLATGRVIKPGRTLTVCELEVEVWKDGTPRTCAWGLQTVICLRDRSDGPG